jgi:hypothetical protein
MAWKNNMQSHSQINFPWALSNHYCHEIMSSIDFCICKTTWIKWIEKNIEFENLMMKERCRQKLQKST